MNGFVVGTLIILFAIAFGLIASLFNRTATGGGSTFVGTPFHAVVTDADGNLQTSAITTADDITNISGTTGNVQLQLNSLDTNLNVLTRDFTSAHLQVTASTGFVSGTISGAATTEVSVSRIHGTLIAVAVDFFGLQSTRPDGLSTTMAASCDADAFASVLEDVDRCDRGGT